MRPAACARRRRRLAVVRRRLLVLRRQLQHAGQRHAERGALVHALAARVLLPVLRRQRDLLVVVDRSHVVHRLPSGASDGLCKAEPTNTHAEHDDTVSRIRIVRILTNTVCSCTSNAATGVPRPAVASDVIPWTTTRGCRPLPRCGCACGAPLYMHAGACVRSAQRTEVPAQRRPSVANTSHTPTEWKESHDTAAVLRHHTEIPTPSSTPDNAHPTLGGVLQRRTSTVGHAASSVVAT